MYLPAPCIFQLKMYMPTTQEFLFYINVLKIFPHGYIMKHI